jgi:hypothetical protein
VRRSSRETTAILEIIDPRANRGCPLEREQAPARASAVIDPRQQPPELVRVQWRPLVRGLPQPSVLELECPCEVRPVSPRRTCRRARRRAQDLARTPIIARHKPGPYFNSADGGFLAPVSYLRLSEGAQWRADRAPKISTRLSLVAPESG